MAARVTNCSSALGHVAHTGDLVDRLAQPALADIVRIGIEPSHALQLDHLHDAALLASTCRYHKHVFVLFLL